MLPTFIIAGAQKSGTTSVWEYLKAHPQVCMANIKETNFFTAQGRSARHDKGLDWYQNLFKFCVRAKAIGEVSPNYMFSEDAPRLMSQFVPDVQLLFILRDPIDRLYSHYWYQHQEGLPLPRFEEMVEKRHPQLEHFIYVSSYHLHLIRFLDYFPREQLSVFLNEDMRKNPGQVMRDIYHCIGVDAEVTPVNVKKEFNTARQARFYVLQRMIETIGLKVMKLDMPDWTFELMKRGRKTLWMLNSTAIQYPPITLELRRELIGEFKETIEYIESFLDHSIPAWRGA